MEPKVTVVLPFYNAEETLNRAIESISEQDFRNFECILVNNNSTDKSTGIANTWTRRDKRFRLIHEPEQGVVFASNTGACYATGKYIARMDADDWAYPDRLTLQTFFL